MLVDVQYKGNKLITSYIDENGLIKMKYFNWNNPTKWIPTSEEDPDKDGKFVTWNGEPVKQVYTKYPNKYSIYYFLDSLPEEDKKLFFEYHEPNIFFLDIENEVTLDGKIDPTRADGVIQTLSIVNKNKVLVMGIKPLEKNVIESINVDINNYFKTYGVEYEFKYIYYKTEYEMLLNLFKNMIPKMSVITGWNFVFYDWVYLVNRARNVGIDPSVVSFTNELKKSFLDNDPSELPYHRVIVDYMKLFEKIDTSVKIKDSLSLDFAAEKILKVKKVNYEGNLTHLYDNDFKKYVFYNAVDSILVKKIHEKMRYLDILYGIAIISKISLNDAISKQSNFSTLAVTEGIMRDKLKKEKNIILCRNTESSSDVGVGDGDMGVKGGYVKPPTRGMSTFTCCFDFSSLYPTTMRQFNISPDSYRGQKVKGKDYTIFNGHELQIEDDDIVCINNSVYKPKDSVVKDVMTSIFAERKKYKKKMINCAMELDDLKKELKRLEEEI